MAIDLEKIKQDCRLFKRLLDLVPPDVYFNEDDKAKLGEIKQKENDARIKSKSKKCKFDPQHKVSNLVEKLADIDEPDILMTRSSTIKSSSNGLQQPLETAYQRLVAKMEILREKRKASKGDSSEKQKLKRRMSKAKRKLKLQQLKTTTSAAATEKKFLAPTESITGKTAKAIYNKDGSLVFSKFDLGDSAKRTNAATKKRLEQTGKNYAKLLSKASMKKAKVEELRKKDALKAQQMQTKDSWMTAVNRAEGIKVKDNPELLKKALKRRQKVKRASAKGWAARQQHVADQQQKKQEKRAKNLESRRTSKKQTKLKHAAKKGRLVPGF